MQNELSYYPTVSWGDRKKEQWSSKIHYANGDKTLCGRRIPRNRPPANDPWDMCERCAELKEKKGAGLKRLA